MKKRNVFLAVLICLCITGLVLSALFRKPASDQPVSPLHEPVVEKDSTLSTEQVTEWACISFGSYPQTEIIRAPSEAVDEYAVQEGDYLQDPELYDRLAAADWYENETEIDGIRYLRMDQDDAAASASDREGHYRWGDEKEWHYFRYDPIRWRIIGLEEGKAMLMADRLLDCQPYNTEDCPVSWEKSSLRSWLNGLCASENTAGIDYSGRGFLDKAFSDDEQQAVLLTDVENSRNSRYGTDGGADTEDYVFLLSNEEVFGTDIAARNGFYQKNGKDDPAKRFRSTMYAKCRGAWWSSVNGYRGNSFWFMRTNGYTPQSVTYICDFGYIYQRGTISTCEDAGILPALWISLADAQYEIAGTVTSKDIQTEASFDPDGSENNKDLIVNPVVIPDEKQPDGKIVEYSMVRFGSYPQSEVVPEFSGASDGSIADADLYAALQKAGWNNDECICQGTVYIRKPGTGENGYRYFACEPLLWRVLEVNDGTALLLSDAAIECEPFQKDLNDVSWENCTLRSWLNGYTGEMNVSDIDYSADNFLDAAFSPAEQEAIIDNYTRNENNYYFGTDSGSATTDKVFIPAESELFVYDSSEIHGFSRRDEVPDRAKQFVPTDYAVYKGVWSDSAADGYGNVFWITRTTGYTHSNVVYADESGYMYNRGILVTCSDAAVIPALVLDLDSSVYEYAGTKTVE